MKVWLGEEKEGKYQGIVTLFIGSPAVTFKDLENIASKHYFEQIYFGAGRCSKINMDVLEKCIEQFVLCKIMIETDIEDLHKFDKRLFTNNRVEIMVSVTNKKFKYLKHIPHNRIQLKIQALTDDKDMYISLGQLALFDIVNDKELKGKKYIGDKVLLK